MAYGNKPPRFFMFRERIVREDHPTQPDPQAPIYIWEGKWIEFTLIEDLIAEGKQITVEEAEDFLTLDAISRGEEKVMVQGRLHAMPHVPSK